MEKQLNFLKQNRNVSRAIQALVYIRAYRRLSLELVWNSVNEATLENERNIISFEKHCLVHNHSHHHIAYAV